MPDEQGTIRSVAWREIFPWLSLTRAVRLSLRARMLALASAGVLVTIFGWWVLGWVFGGADGLKPYISRFASCPWEAADAAPPFGLPGPNDFARGSAAPSGLATPSLTPLGDAWSNLSQPARSIFEQGVSFTALAYLLLVMFWGIGVWAYFGGALVRLAAMQLGREEGITLGAALRHARQKWLSYFASPLLPLIGVLLITLPMLVVGLLLKFAFGVLLASLIWPLMLIGGLLMAIVLLGLMFGWPLMWPAIGTEGTDSFDALSRSYSYVFQRPLHYLWYALVAGFLGVLAAVLVNAFAAGVVYLTDWAASWGSGYDHSAWVLLGKRKTLDSGVELWGLHILWFWQGCVRLVAIGFVYSYFWSAATQIYLLLRYDTDGTETDEVYVEESEESFGLPPLKTDAAGVPVVDEEPESPPSEAQ